MALRLALIVVVIVGLAGMAVLGVLALAPPPPPPSMAAAPAAPVRVSLLVAERAVQAGTLLKPEDLAARDIASADMPLGGLRDSPEARIELIGAMVRRTLAPGDVLRLDAVLRPGESGFLAAVLAPGMRAVTVGVDAVTGAAGLIWPGDRVDVILTQAFEENDIAPARRVAGETVLPAARVIAVDRHLVQGMQPGAVGDSLRESNRTVTIEVTPEQATRVAVATRLGRLSLALRAAGTPMEERVEQRPVWGGDVSGAFAPAGTAATAAAAGAGARIRVFGGPGRVEEIQFR
ncbi:Flp pilus assembly protein CpaB [Roseomonas eburnea]|uniref:Flp pilus assembly protein CpaB n=1 Tax=Neoroseomonas eburnea TaxID=1346889 RepID=A0A9X9XA42_9PROT|nr:Flp pilus assembly protein CpaB [Neoroseomonas eburnea]MBR0680578.1 Flp pilus assembly protein CpaB [Neoroseomonas eburnea]